MSHSFMPPRHYTSSLTLISTNYAIRCDAKYADAAFLELEQAVRSKEHFELGEFLPIPFVKGIQPQYLDQPTDDSVPVINTLSIQNLSLNLADCRHMPRDDFEEMASDRKVQPGDVLLTVDGGVSIGKPLFVKQKMDIATDSHVVILRPHNLEPLSLTYMLASPFAQSQFRRAESGASGQTTVTEDDIRRFIFPRSILADIDEISMQIEQERLQIEKQRAELLERERSLWEKLEFR